MEAAAAPTESHGRPIEKHRVTSDEEFFHLVFSNKTENDERALEIRSELIRRAGLSIWQQTTNIPKDSDNWFNEWYPSASKAIKIPCYLTVNYLKSPYCMKEFGIALAKGKLLAIAIDPLSEIVKVDPSEFPHASNALAYLEGGGQVIFDDAEDTVAEILKFTPDVERMPAVAPVAPPAPKSPSPAPSSPGPANAWPAELAELMSIPAFVACLAELDVHSMVDFADCIDVDEGHDEQLRAVLEALPSKPRKNKVLRNRVLASLADLMQRLSIFIEYDSEEKASLSRVDCLRIPVEKMQAKAGGSVGEHFDKIDADKDGRITFEEMFEHTEVTAGEGTPPAQAGREAALSAPEAELLKLKADLEEFNLANASYTAEMAGLEGQIGALQAALDTIGQKIPSLEGEQKAAAAARNFKEAGRLKKLITEAQGDQETKKAELETQKAAKAAKEAENSEAAAQLVALEGAVAAQEKKIGSTQFDGLVQSISEAQGRLTAVKTADPDASDCGLLEAKLELFTGQAQALTTKYSLGPVERPAVAPASIETRERIVASTPELPKPKPAMTEDEALECLRTFSAKVAAIEAELEAKQAAEDYDACDALAQQQEELEAAHATAQTIIPMTMAEATQIAGSFAAESTRLQESIAEKMEAEDYDACDALQAELDALSAKHEIAQKLAGGAPPVSAAVSEGVPPAAAAAPAPAADSGMLGGFDFSAPAPAADAAAPLGGFDFGSSAVPNGDAPPAAAAAAASDVFGKEEATALLAKLAELEEELAQKMQAEDYDRCEEINAEVEKLSERKDEAIALTADDE